MKRIIAYHGTSESFESFDYRFIGCNGTSKGYGFYFSDSFDTARKYAKKDYEIKRSGTPRVYEVQLTLYKPASLQAVTLSKADIYRLCTPLRSVILQAYSTIYEAIESEYGENSDVDIINSLIHGTGNRESILRSAYKALRINYAREIISPDESHYIIFISEHCNVVRCHAVQ